MCSPATLVCCLVAAVLPTLCAQRRELYEGDACSRVAGVEWTCKKLKDCAKAQESLENGLRPETCGFTDNEAIVCCEPTTRPTQQKPKPLPTQITKRPTQSTQKPTQGGGEKSKQKCREYAKSVRIKVEIFDGDIILDTCTIVEALITNGVTARAREFPHMALIGYNSSFRGIKWACGGSLISERFVLSAAHCNPKNPTRVRLGDYNIKSTQDDENKDAKSVDFNIIQVIEHPKYDADKSYNDITLYKLDRNVKFNEYIRPICLQTEYQLPKDHGIISGWGHTEFGGMASDVLMKGNVSYVSGQECSKVLNPFLQNKQSVVRDDMMICAGNFVNGTDTCQGDSGGPLQNRLADPYCMYSLVGITSFGLKCGFNNGKVFPAIYTRVSTYVPWIESIVWP